MDRYTIYCTEAQTKKALELGAPIKTYKPIIINSKAGGSFTTPTIETVTAEQMIGWLEEQRLGIDVTSDNYGYEWSVWVKKEHSRTLSFVAENQDYIDSRKEATLAAIDAALDYLSNKK